MEEKNLFKKCEIYFSLVEEDRDERYTTYSLSYILFMVMCGIICGCKDLEEMVEVLENKIEVIQKYIEIERIPCLSTFSNILSELKVLQVELCILSICRNVVNDTLIVGEKPQKIQIESMHWILDVNFKEDDCPVRSENTQKILNMLRKLAIKLHSD